jgi:hypothetical protein
VWQATLHLHLLAPLSQSRLQGRDQNIQAASNVTFNDWGQMFYMQSSRLRMAWWQPHTVVAPSPERCQHHRHHLILWSCCHPCHSTQACCQPSNTHYLAGLIVCLVCITGMAARLQNSVALLAINVRMYQEGPHLMAVASHQVQSASAQTSSSPCLHPASPC